LPPLSDELLQKRMVDAVNMSKREVVHAIDELKNISSETLTLIKSLVSEAFYRPYLSDESIEKLEYTARVFAGLGDTTWMLHESATDLRRLGDYGEILYESAHRLRTAPDYAPILYEASLALQHLPEYAPLLSRAADSLQGLPAVAHLLANIELSGEIRQLDQAADRLLNASSSLQRQTDDAAHSIETALAQYADLAGTTAGNDVDWSWRAFKWGAGTCLGLVVLILGLWTVILLSQGV
jgi:hypothetical protein